MSSLDMDSHTEIQAGIQHGRQNVNLADISYSRGKIAIKMYFHSPFLILEKLESIIRLSNSFYNWFMMNNTNIAAKKAYFIS